MLNAGDEVVMAQGTFISYYLRTLELAATPIRVPLHNYRHDLMALADAITPQTRMVFVCNPNNPTGTSNGDAELRAFLARVPDDVLVVVDEAYIEFVNRADFPDLLSDVRAGQPNLLLLRTFAKIHGLAGLRLGYALGAPSLINYLEKTRPTFNVNLLAQVAGLAALNDEEHLARSKAHADTSRTYFERELTALGLEAISSETNFVAFAVGDDGAVSDALRERGFSVTPLSGWGLPGVIRVSFGTMAQNEAFIGALQEVIADSR
jgi:histidinol-phosphate aminotransferase